MNAHRRVDRPGRILEDGSKEGEAEMEETLVGASEIEACTCGSEANPLVDHSPGCPNFDPMRADLREGRGAGIGADVRGEDDLTVGYRPHPALMKVIATQSERVLLKLLAGDKLTIDDAERLRGVALEMVHLHALADRLWADAENKTWSYARKIAAALGVFPEGWDGPEFNDREESR